MLISKISMLATPAMIASGFLASGASAMAQSDAEADASVERTPWHSCSNRTLSGAYGYAAEGLLSPAPGVPPELQFRSVGEVHLDGKGNFRGVEHTVVNGASLETDWTANRGTYSVNPNCTGKLVLVTPNSPVPLNLFFVVVREGREFRTVLDASAISSTWIKVE